MELVRIPKALIREAFIAFRKRQPIRLRPCFIVIGGQRCGTTSLFKYILQHPEVASPLGKEIHYFDLHFNKGLPWYLAHFPKAPRNHGSILTGEASPYYIFHPLVPERIAGVLPRVKIIAILRNPVERAYSHFQHEKRKGREKLSFEKAIEAERQRLEGEEDRIENKKGYYSYAHHRFSYLSRGLYIEQLKRWYGCLPKESILILQTESLIVAQNQNMDKVFRFLGKEPTPIQNPKKYHKKRYQKLDQVTREHLAQFFKPYNKQLYDYIAQDFGWS